MKTGRISLRDHNGRQVFSVAIKSLKHDREYILGLLRIYPETMFLNYNGRTFTESDIYAGRSGHLTPEVK